MEEKERVINILVVEDLESDVFIIRRILEKSNLRNRLFVTMDGEEALDFLYQRAKYADAKKYPRPDIVLLDLHLPKLDGIEVLKEIRGEEKLKDIPVVVFTASESDKDIITTYEMGVKSYIMKSAFIEKTAKMDGLPDLILSLI